MKLRENDLLTIDIINKLKSNGIEIVEQLFDYEDRDFRDMGLNSLEIMQVRDTIGLYLKECNLWQEM